ncbi:hypothetical protein HMI56_002924 [Coelomomyces lativittatus]|nr:hypothetical protein HMI56_002924 [Coelomomyces lativittatus]
MTNKGNDTTQSKVIELGPSFQTPQLHNHVHTQPLSWSNKGKLSVLRTSLKSPPSESNTTTFTILRIGLSI